MRFLLTASRRRSGVKSLVDADVAMWQRSGGSGQRKERDAIRQSLCGYARSLGYPKQLPTACRVPAGEHERDFVCGRPRLRLRTQS